MFKKHLILILIVFLTNSSVYSTEKNTNSSEVGKGGSENYSYLIAKNSNYKKGKNALKQAKKYHKKEKRNKAKKRFNDAIKFFTLANKEYPQDPDILNYLGYSLKKVDDFIMAEIYYTNGLEINPKHIGLNANLIRFYIETNRIDKAKERLKVLENCKCKEFDKLQNLISKY